METMYKPTNFAHNTAKNAKGELLTKQELSANVFRRFDLNMVQQTQDSEDESNAI